MPIDVLYEGMVLARGTRMVASEAGTLVELEAPMPVGCQLTLDDNGTTCPVRVVRVHEGVGSGVFVVALAGALPGQAQVVKPSSLPPPAPAPTVVVPPELEAKIIIESSSPDELDEPTIEVTGGAPDAEDMAAATAAAGGVVAEVVPPESTGEVTEPNDTNGRKSSKRKPRGRKNTRA